MNVAPHTATTDKPAHDSTWVYWRIPGAWLTALAAYFVIVGLLDPLAAARVTYFACGLGSILAGVQCARAAQAAEGRRRWGWRLFASACAASLAGQLLWIWIEATTPRPPAIAVGPDLLFVAFGVLIALAVHSFRTPEASRASALRRLANIALLSTAFAAACVAAFLEPALQPRGSIYSFVVAVLQLLVFAIAFIIALYLLWSYRWSSLSGPVLRVVAAVTLQAACGLVYVHSAYVLATGPPVYVSGAWVAAFGLLYWAGQEELDGADRDEASTRTHGRNERLVDALLPGALLLLVLLALFAFRNEISQRSLVIAGILVAVFAIVLAAREALLYFEEQRLAGELASRKRELAATQATLLSKTTALQEKEQWLKLAADAGHVGLWAWDLVTNAVYYSPEWKRQLGYEEHEIKNDLEEWRARVHPDDLERALEQVRAFIEHPWQDYQLEVRMRHRDGSYRWILTQAALLRGPDGAARSMVGSHVDITRRKEAEQRLREREAHYRELAGELEQRVARRTDELQQAYRELESFAYAVAHDLKAPLRAMNGFSALLTRSAGDKLCEEERSYLERIAAGAARMNALIEGLLDYSRIDRRAMRKESIAFAELINSALSQSAAEIEERRVEVHILGAETPVHGDREAIAVILRNLVDNAVKFTRRTPAAPIETGARIVEGSLLLWVKDNGIGFEQQYHDQIFAMFNRLHRDDQYPGTGIGLALAAKAAQRMGGRLWAESAPGCGATFYFETAARSSA